jgi:hypothetical protein
MNQRTAERQYECPGCGEWHLGLISFNFVLRDYRGHEDKHGRRWHSNCWAKHRSEVDKAEAVVQRWVKARRVRRRARIIRKLLRVAAAIFSL